MSTTTCYSAPAIPGAGDEVVTAVASEAEEAAASDGQSRKNLSLYANLSAAEIIDSLPMETRFPVPHRQYGGFWKAEFLLKGMVLESSDATTELSGDCKAKSDP
ncbi:unnamed protein product [Miscanthus lutarioriparius]|uniref:Uncharacterized protein n=1 Tax=Miscanthus lutarioriparius TaxID=422564 RepID=A0A811QAZ1_9POAL|nr:unnamed protein product [Miscanthus lutarioriparius]